MSGSHGFHSDIFLAKDSSNSACRGGSMLTSYRGGRALNLREKFMTTVH